MISGASEKSSEGTLRMEWLSSQSVRGKPARMVTRRDEKLCCTGSTYAWRIREVIYDRSFDEMEQCSASSSGVSETQLWWDRGTRCNASVKLSD
jgi:hypothetical protein